MSTTRPTLAGLLLVAAAATATAQGNSTVAEADLPKLKLSHYFTPDKKSHPPEFAWAFTKTGFTLKKGTGGIPRHLLDALLPDGSAADEVTGKWAMKDGKLELTEIAAGKQAGRKGVALAVFKTSPTVVRIGDPEQSVFAVEK